MQTLPATLSMTSAPALAPNRMADAARGMAGSFETALEALGASCEPAREDEGPPDSGPPPGSEEEPPDGETENLAWPCLEPLATQGQPPMGPSPAPAAAVTGAAGAGDDGVPAGFSASNGDAAFPLQGATPNGPAPAVQGAQSGFGEMPPSGRIGPQGGAPDLLGGEPPTSAAVPRQASFPPEGRTARIAPELAGGASSPPESARPREVAVAEMPAPAQDGILTATPASACAGSELGQPADLSAGVLVLQAGTRDAPPAVPEATALHRSVPAEPHRQIADAIVRSRDGQVEVTLNPVELGRVTVLLGAEGNPGHLALFVERPETLELIRRHSDQLLRDLRDGGMPDPSLDLLQQDGQGRPRDRGQQGEGWTAAHGRAPDSPREPVARVVSLSRLDIRL